MSLPKNKKNSSVPSFAKSKINIHVAVLLFVLYLVSLSQPVDGQTTTGGTTNINVYDTGDQVGRTASGAVASPAAFSGEERPDSASFSMSEPILSLPGRGLSVNLDLRYNSALYQVLNSEVVSTRDSYYHDLNHYIEAIQGYPGYGFSLGFGVLVHHNGSQGCGQASGMFCGQTPPQPPIAGGYSFIDPSGASHYFNQGLSVDSSNIRLGGIPGGPNQAITYSDGTTVFFGSQVGQTTGVWTVDWIGAGTEGCSAICHTGDIMLYPYQIRDRNGNYIQITYVNNTGPRISTIQDSLGRTITFHYDPTNTNLLSITVPGFEPNTEREVVRFYYANRNRDHSFLNQPTYLEVIKVLTYVYFPGTKSGYHYSYSTYGMIYKVEKLLGMDAASNGTLTNYGQTVASTEYNYPTTEQPLSGEIPKYTTRTDWCAGNTSSTPPTQFTASFSTTAHTSTATITSPDGTISKVVRRWYPGPNYGMYAQWDTGIILQEEVIKDSKSYARVDYSWQSSGWGPRLYQKIETNDALQQKRTTYTYETMQGCYNNIHSMSEFGFDGAEIRRTEFDYEKRNEWLTRYLVKLVTSVRIYEGGATLPSAQTDYAYDTDSQLTTYNDIPMHVDNVPINRGNLTRISKNTNAANPSQGQAITETLSYDVTGNVVSHVDPNGNLTLTGYSTEFKYAYPTSTQSAIPDPYGEQGLNTFLTTSTSYNFNTGLITSVRDVNNQFINYDYYAQTNRVKMISQPDGGWKSYTYGDAPTEMYVDTHQAIDGIRYTDSYQYFDGRGRPIRSIQNDGAQWVILDTQYDLMGRQWKVSNPYFSAQGNGSPINPSGLWTVMTYDALGRSLSIKTPDMAEVKTDYYGGQTLVMDAAGKQRLSQYNALGQITDVWEIKASDPNDTDLVPITFPNHQEVAAGYRTKYTYNAFSKLTKVEQSAQTRIFAYDSLSRLVNATLPESGSTSYLYDAAGNLKEKNDSRGIKTSYTYDGLNRNLTVTYLNDAGNTQGVKRYYDFAANGKGRLWKSERLGSEGTLVTISSYDVTGRPLVLSQQFRKDNLWSASYTEQRSYDLAGHVSSATYPSGHTANYTFDSSGRTQSVTGNLGDGVSRSYATEIAYDESDQMTQEKLGTGIATATNAPTPLYHKLGYNVRGQLSEVRLSTRSRQQAASDWNRGCLLFYYSNITLAAGYSDRDNNGNTVRMEHWVPFNDQNDNTVTYRFTQDKYDYDAFNRLASVTENENGQPGVQLFKQSYKYDRYGNRKIDAVETSQTPGINRQQFDVELATNKLYAPGDLSLPVEQRQMKYDAAGNLAKDIYSGAGLRTYDAENRMTSATDSSTGAVSRYVYDADGKRVRRFVNNQETWQVYGMSGQLLAEYSAGSAPFIPTKEYGYRSGEMFVVASNGDEQRLARFINQLYQGAFGRDASATDMQTKLNSLGAAGAQGQAPLLSAARAVANELFTSPDYLNRLRTNRQYVADLYWAYFDRAADVYTLDYWEGRLQSTDPNNQITREQLRQVCENWAEFTTLVDALWGANDTGENQRTEHFLWNVYLGTTGGVPTTAAMQPQIDALNSASASGKDAVISKAEEICRQMITSSAYTARQRTNEEYVADLYETFWQREPDVDLWSYWTRQVATRGRSWVLDRFATSTAFREVAGTLYRETLWLIPDQLGTPRMVAERTGSLAGIKRHDYLPFGEELVSVGGRTAQQGYVTDGVKQQFTTKERDTETGLDYFGARYYANIQGRFTSPDNVDYSKTADPQTWNEYIYCRNGPLNRVDPDGHNYFFVLGADGSDSWVWADGNVYTDPATGATYRSEMTHIILVTVSAPDQNGRRAATVILYGENWAEISKENGYVGKEGEKGNEPVLPGEYFINLANYTTKSSIYSKNGNLALAPFYGVQIVEPPVLLNENGKAREVAPGQSTYGFFRAVWGTKRANLSPAVWKDGQPTYAPGTGSAWYIHGHSDRRGEYTLGCVGTPGEHLLNWLTDSATGKTGYNTNVPLPVTVKYR